RVVPEECLPALRRRPTPHHVFRHRRLGDLKAKHQQLAMDPGCSPLWVFLAHLSNEIAQLSIDLWPPCPLPRFPTPDGRETRTMPAKDGRRLNDLRCTKQARPEPGHPDQQGPVTAAQSKTRRCTPQGDAKLMAKEQVLRFKSARRLEDVNDEHYERMQEREHRPRSCDDSTRRCDSQAGRYFRKGQVWLVLTVSKCLPAGPLFAVGSPESAAPHLSKTCPAYNSNPGTLTCARDLIRGPRAALDHPKSTLQPNLRTPLRCL